VPPSGIYDIDISHPDVSVRYLGRQICMTDFHEAEFCNRMRAAWACFTLHRKELTNKRYPIKNRLKLFEATVSATALYGCEAWTLKIDQQKRLRTTQRKMLRTVLGAKRRVINNDGSSETTGGEQEAQDGGEETLLEPWPDFLRRTTRRVEDLLAAAKLEDWLTTWRRRQWKWAGQVVNSQTHKWSHAVLGWRPDLHGRHKGHRTRRRPCKRWEDSLADFCKGLPGAVPWRELAKNKDAWNKLEDTFAKQ